MSPFVFAVLAAVAVDDGAIAIALDDGTVWLVGDGEWEEIGACPDGEVAELEADARTAELAVTCGDGTAWRWSASDGWTPVDPWDDDVDVAATVDAPSADALAVPLRSWWPQLELIARGTRDDADAPAYEGWVRLRWDL